MLRTRFAGAFCIISSLFGQVAPAGAEVTLQETGRVQTSPDHCSLRVDGLIEKGDAARVEEKLNALIATVDNYPHFDTDKQIVVCLSGPGGNYLEGIEMARLHSRLDVTTSVPDGESCLSACAIAFLGGRLNTRSGAGFEPSRYLFPGSRIGFHAPQLSVQDGNCTKNAVLSAYKVALDAISELQKDGRKLYISPDLITEIVRHRDEDFYYIETVDDLAHFSISLHGYSEKPIRRDTRQAACWNAFQWRILGQNARIRDDEWTGIFSLGQRDTIRRGGRILYVFTPFDGEMYCEVTKPADAPANGPVLVVLSEFEDMSNPRVSFYTTPMILMRGNRTLDSTR